MSSYGGTSSKSSGLSLIALDETCSGSLVSTLDLDRVRRLDALVQQRVRHAFGQTPLGEQLGRLLERSGLPGRVDDVGVEVVFGRAAARVVEVPEVAR